MRYQEFKTLLEYDRSKTVQALGNSILRAAQRDSYLKSRNLDDEQTVSAVIDAAEEADPTANKQYVQWIVRQFTKRGMRYEDLYKLKADLSVFAKTKGQHKRLGINSDINQYDWRSLADTAKKLDDTEIADPETVSTTDVEGAKVLYNGPLGTLTVPETKEASCELGRGTKWCTAADNRNMFDHYNNQGPLYIWHDKKLKTKFQFHFESGQFMDAQDNPIDPDTMHELTVVNPVVSKLFKKNAPKVLGSYLEYLEIQDERQSDDYDEWEYDGPDESILDIDLGNLITSLSFEEAVKLLKPAIMYSDIDGEYLKNSLTKRFIKNKELKKVEQLNNRYSKQFLSSVKRYYVTQAPVEQAVQFVLDNQDDTGIADAAVRIANRADGPVSKLEDIIAKDGRAAYLYAYHSLAKQRFPKGEPEIAKDAWAATWYVKNILKQRWPAAEPAIKQYDGYWKEYQDAINEN